MTTRHYIWSVTKLIFSESNRLVKTELEEAGLETEGMAETTASLQAKLLALTNQKVDIMIDDNSFKSTTQILREMAGVWEEMTDVQQAAALELIGGKRQANILSSLISNFDVAEDAIETAANSAGSAFRENAVWLDSIEGKTTTLKNSIQNMWNNSIVSDGAKAFLDVANSVVKVIDKVGLLRAAIVGVTGLLSASGKNSFGNIFNINKDYVAKYNEELTLFQNMKKAFTGSVSLNDKNPMGAFLGSIKSGDAIKSFTKEYNKAYDALQRTSQGMQSAGIAQKTLNAITAAGTAITKTSTAADVAKAASTAAVGVASKVAAAGAMALQAAYSMGLSLLITGALTTITEFADKAIETNEELGEKVDELTSKYKEQHDTLVNNKLDFSTDAKRFAELSRGVNELGENISLTSSEYEEYQNLANSIADQVPSLVAGYDEQGNAILNCAGNVDALTSAYERLIKAQNDDILLNAKEIEEDFSNVVKETNTQGEFSNTEAKALKEILDNKYTADEIADNILMSASRSEIVKAIQDAGIEVLDKETGEILKPGLSNNDYNKYIAAACDQNADAVKTIVNNFNSELEAETEGMQSIAEATLSNAFDISDSKYADMSGTMKNLARQIVSGFDYDFYAGLEASGVSVEDYINNMLDQFNQLDDNGQSLKLEAAFDLRTQFNNGEVSYGEYINGIKDVESLINNLNVDDDVKNQIKLSLNTEDTVKEYDALKNRLTSEEYNIKFSTENAESFIDGLTAQELSIALDVIPDLAKSDAEIKAELKELGDGGAVDLLMRPVIDASLLTDAGWEDAGEGAATVFTNTFSNKAGDIAMNFTPIIADENGKHIGTLSPEELTKYAEGVVNGTREDDLNLQIGAKFEGEDAIDDAEAAAQRIHDLHDMYYLDEGISPSTLQSAIDLEKALRGISDIDMAAQTAGIEALNTALSESRSAAGLTADSIAALKGRYEDLDGYNAASLFEKTANGIHLNNEELRRLEAQYINVNKLNIDSNLNTLATKYNELTDQIESCSDAQEKELLQAEADTYADRIEELSILAAQYEGLTSAFNEWQSAQSGAEEGDNYDSIYDGLKGIKELYDKGLVGTDKFRASVQLMSAEDLSTAEIDELIAAYDKGYPKMKRYFTEGAEGCQNFLNDVSKLNSEWAHMNKDGTWEIDFGTGNDQEVAEALGINVDTVQQILRKLKDYGFEVEIDSEYSSLNGLQTKIEETETRLKELDEEPVDIDVDIETNAENIQTIESEIENAKSKINEINNSSVEPDVKTAQLEDAQAKLETLIDKKIEASEPAFMKLNTSQVSASLVDALGKVQDYQSALNELNKLSELKEAGIKIDDSQLTLAQQKVDECAQSIQGLDGDVKLSIGLEQDGSIESIKQAFEEGKVQIDTDTSPAVTKVEQLAENVDKIENKDVTINVTVKGLDDVKELNSNIDLATSIDGDMDALSEYVEGAKTLSELGSNIVSFVTAEVDGNVTDAKNKELERLKVFAESAKPLKDVGSFSAKIDATVNADIDGSVTEQSTKALDNLSTFTKTAESLSGIGDVPSTITANIDGNVTEEGNKLLKKFSDVATVLSSISSVVVKVTAQVATDAINNALTLLQRVKDSKLFTNYNAKVTVSADDTAAMTTIQNVNNAVLNEKILNISETGSQAVLTALDNINSKTLKDKTVKVNYVKGTMPAIPGPGGRDGDMSTPWPYANGTAHAKGTAWAGGTAYKGGNWGAPVTSKALVGELGPEIVVRGSRWFTVGDNGAEFANIQKGDIIFNHKQTEQLLSNGYVTSRGKAHAQGTALAEGNAYSNAKGVLYSLDGDGRLKKTTDNITSKNKKKNKKKAKDEFEEIFDWFEVKIEEINEDLDLMAAKLENAASIKSKNNFLDDMIKASKTELTTLKKGQELYEAYADSILKKTKKVKNKKTGKYESQYIIPKKYWDEAKDGKIAIEEFAGKTDEKTLEAIKNYREWAQKAADISKQIQEVESQIAEYAKQKFDNIADRYSSMVDLQGAKKGHIEDMIDYQEAKGEPVSSEYYEDLMWRTKGGKKDGRTIDGQLGKLQKERDKLQDSLDASVKKGDIKKYSDQWYDMVAAIHDVDAQIQQCNMDLEEYQNAINEIHWDNFDELINRFEYLSEEAQNTIDLMSDKDMFVKNDNDKGWGKDDVPWTKEGLASIGLYAQQMEIAKKKAQAYKDQMTYLDQAYEDGKYSESEYLEKMNELKQGYHDEQQNIKDSTEAIQELNEARIEHVKEGIEKQIEAYEELIDKKKEELDAEKDLYDFQKSVQEQQKDIAKLERQLAALSGDNSASAIAKRKQLEAELAEAKADLEETYYDQSITTQQEALDNKLEIFQEEKDAEMEALDEYLENTELVVADSMNAIQSSGEAVLQALNGLAEEYGVNISDALKKPWEDAATAIATTTSNIEAIKTDYQNDISGADQAAEEAVDDQRQANVDTEAEKKDKFTKGQKVTAKKGTVAYNSKGKKDFTVGYNSDYTVVSVDNKTGLTKVKNADGKIRYFKTDDLKVATSSGGSGGSSGNSKYYKKYTGKSTSIVDALKAIGVDGSKNNRKKIAQANDIKNYSGTAKQNAKLLDLLKKGKLKKYATGSLGIDKDQIGWLDELGEELQLIPGGNGRLAYIKKGTGIVPADMTERLMNLATNSQDILDRNRPSIGMSPSVTHNEVNITMDIAEVVHIDHVDSNTVPDVTKAVEKQLDKYMQNLNGKLKKYTR